MQGQGHDGYIIDAFGLDQSLHHAQVFRHQICIFFDRIVQSDQGLRAWDTDLELHRQDRDTRFRDGKDMVNASHLGQDLFAWNRDHLLNIFDRSSRKRRDDIGHRDIDLRLLLSRRHQHSKHTKQQGHKRQQRCDLSALKSCGQSTRHTQFFIDAHGCLLTCSRQLGQGLGRPCRPTTSPSKSPPHLQRLVLA